jgi:hypothetical protein
MKVVRVQTGPDRVFELQKRIAADGRASDDASTFARRSALGEEASADASFSSPRNFQILYAPRPVSATSATSAATSAPTVRTLQAPRAAWADLR